MNNKQAKELKLCPFCGGGTKSRLSIFGSDEFGYFACKKCGAYSGPKTNYLTDAAKAWNTRTNTDLEEAQAQVRVLTEALGEIYEKCLTPSESHLKSIGCEQWAEGVAETIIDKHKALSSSHIATYQAARAVIDAVNFNSGTLTIIAQGNHFGSETVTHLLKLNTALQELEHNNAGGES